MDIRGSKCRPKSSIAQEMKTHRHEYHLDLELSDRSRERLGMKTHGRGKEQNCSTRQGLHVGTSFVEFRQTPER